MNAKSFKKGEIIIEEGSPSKDAYIIELGSVEVSKRSESGNIQVLTKLDKNDIFGEMGLIDSLPRSANVVATEDCTISVMTQEIFNSLSKHKPEALMPILKIMASRLRGVLIKIEGIQGKQNLSRSIPAGS